MRERRECREDNLDAHSFLSQLGMHDCTPLLFRDQEALILHVGRNSLNTSLDTTANPLALMD
jgi:hypothetical protein